MYEHDQYVMSDADAAAFVAACNKKVFAAYARKIDRLLKHSIDPSGKDLEEAEAVLVAHAAGDKTPSESEAQVLQEYLDQQAAGRRHRAARLAMCSHDDGPWAPARRGRSRASRDSMRP